MPFVLVRRHFKDRTKRPPFYYYNGESEEDKDQSYSHLKKLLEEFYRDASNQDKIGLARLIAVRRGFGYALDDVFLMTQGGWQNAVDELSKEEVAIVLHEAQVELNRFADFLKHRFLKG